MPRRLNVPLPQQVADAVDAFGLPVRVAIIGALKGSPAMTRGELATVLELEGATVYPNLRALEELGVLEREHETVSPGQRNGYRLRPERVRDLHEALRLFTGVPRS